MISRTRGATLGWSASRTRGLTVPTGDHPAGVGVVEVAECQNPDRRTELSRTSRPQEEHDLPQRLDRPLIYSATRRWLDVVAAGGSLFVPERPVWISPTLDRLYAGIVGDPDFGVSGFQQKLLVQARTLGPEAQRLAVEAMFVFQIKDSDGRAVTKRKQLDALLDGLVPPASLPEDLAETLHFGMAKYGPGRLRSLPDFLFVLRFALVWASFDDGERHRLLGDPWAFRAMLDGVDEKGAVFAREAFKHLLHPETFDAVASLTAKGKILRVLTGTNPANGTDLDRALLDLRERMEADGRGRPGFHFYDAEVRPLWNPQPGDVDLAEEDGEVDGPDGGGLVPPLTPSRLRLGAVEAAVEEAGLRLKPSVLAGLVAALNSGKHVILTGAPGTAKTTLAELVARVAHRAGRCRGHVLATATADWTTYETVGGYRPTTEGDLVFRPGIVLEAIENEHWLILDEMNRANTDRALGPLFTVLSGQAVTLPAEQDGRPVRIRPETAEPRDGFRDYVVPEGWRIIATTNVLDRALLFDLSFALMRRFAFVDVACPEREDYWELVHDAVADMDAAVAARAEELVGRLLPLTDLRPLGPALFKDAALFVASYLVDRPEATDRELLLGTFFAYLLPQFEGADESECRRLHDHLRVAAGAGAGADIVEMLGQALGVSLAAIPPRVVEDEAELEYP